MFAQHSQLRDSIAITNSALVCTLQLILEQRVSSFQYLQNVYNFPQHIKFQVASKARMFLISIILSVLSQYLSWQNLKLNTKQVTPDPRHLLSLCD